MKAEMDRIAFYRPIHEISARRAI